MKNIINEFTLWIGVLNLFVGLIISSFTYSDSMMLKGIVSIIVGFALINQYIEQKRFEYIINMRG